MDIVYIDPGYGKGLTTNGVLTCVESDEYNPVNGVAFTASSGATLRWTIPSSLLSLASAQYNLIKTCLRFSIYLDSTFSGTFKAGNCIASSTSVNTSTPFALIYISTAACGLYTIQSATTPTRTIPVDTPITGFHNATVSVYWFGKGNDPNLYHNYGQHVEIDGKAVLNAISSKGSGTTAAGFGEAIILQLPAQTGCYISNVILATSKESDDSRSNLSSKMTTPLLSPETLLVRLPLSTPPDGDFLSVGDGEYVGNTAGQTLLSTIDAGETSDVITKFGATSKVSHIVTYGNPGYRVGSNIETAYGISQSGNDSIATHGSCSLSADTDASAFVAWEADSGTKLSDLDGLKVGWQV